MSSPEAPPVALKQPLHRTADHEKEDNEQAVQNMQKQLYHEWPNEAGFDGLDEHRGPIDVPVKGSIPAWAAGSLFRTGPGQCKVENTPRDTIYLSHWFDGLAHTHRFDIIPVDQGSQSNGQIEQQHARVVYSSRRQSDELVAYMQKHGNHKMFSFGQKRDPCLGIFSKFMSTFLVPPPNGDKRKLENVAVTVQPPIPGLPSALGGSASSSSIPSSTAKTTTVNGAPVNSDGSGKVTAPETSGHRATSMWLASDTCSMREIDARTLEPIGFATQESLHPSLTGPVSCAHSQRDPVTGDFFNFNLAFGRTPTYRVFRVSAASGKTDILATIERKHLSPAYIHSFFLTANFVVLCLPSAHFALSGLKILWEKNMLDAIEPFDRKKLCKWFVIDRHHGHGVVAEFETPAGFFFHTVNAFEEPVEGSGDGEEKAVEVFCDVMEFPNLDIMYSLYYDSILDREGAATAMWGDEDKTRRMITSLARWKFRVPLPAAPSKEGGKNTPSTGKLPLTPIPEKVLCIPGPHAGELPTINPAYHTRRHRYVYSLPNRGLSTVVDTLVKTDTLTREAIIWDNPRGHTPGEPIFVARPGAVDEDDGVLLSVVLDGLAQTSYLLCLDARDMTELGRAEVPFAVSMGFHGVHLKL
ncbi:Carotenoid cleavage dioxygenase 1 [Pleurostoma richardsiae]|uniref:Carotenoid cleavage dioxygenase 1 n=1 Tax=Pleurostoma richardsiae TaxID=41990 RepID=A0AA38S063_9PEZI|nr:Carotenoid cleavage dioxygenase 1 [Pleurostoma richardsiae]